MKRFHLALFLIFFPFSLFAAFGPSTQWDVRTTGSDTFGCGFDTATAGTDRSQSNSAFVVIDNSAVKATVNASVITFTSGYTATSADVGNIVNIISSTGGTPPTFARYAISTETAGSWTLDRTTGAITATITSAKMGGSCITIATPLALTVSGNGTVYNTVWVQAGTYTLTTGLTFPAVTQVGLVGYSASHGDASTRPLITTATNSTVLVATGSGSNVLLRNLSLSNTAGTRAVGLSFALPTTVSAVLFDGFTSAINNVSVGASLEAISSEIKNSTGAGILQSVAGGGHQIFVYGSYIHDNAGAGISDAGGNAANWLLVNSIFANNGAGGALAAANTDIINAVSCDFVGNTGAGIAASGVASTVVANNSIFYSNSTYGVNGVASASTVSLLAFNNAYGANGTPRNNFPAGVGDVTLSFSPFVSSTNFALNSTVGGGAALKGVGFPGIFPGATTTAHFDIGAVQSAAPSVQVGYPIVQ